MALRADERRDKLRKASGSGKYTLIRRSLNGETWLSKPQSSYGEYIAIRREPGELKHLSSQRKRKQHVISKVAASEMERGQTGVRACRGSDRGIDSVSFNGKVLGKPAKEGESPVHERRADMAVSRVPRDTRNLVEHAGTTP